MKAVIVDLLHGQAAALCDDGRVIKLADAGYTLGQIVEVHGQKRPTRRWVRTLSLIAAAAVLLMGVGGGAAYAMPYGVVSLDMNPAIEYTINRFDYVLSVEGVNEDGKALLAGMDSAQLVHRRIGDAVEAAVAQIEAGDWSESDEILISAGTKTERHSERLLSELETGLRGRRENLQIHALAVSEAEIDEAHRAGMSAGRRHMLRELGEREGIAFSAEDWADRPIGEIMRELDPEFGQQSGQGPHLDRDAETPGKDGDAPLLQESRADSVGQNREIPDGGLRERSDAPPEQGTLPESGGRPEIAAFPFAGGETPENRTPPEPGGAPSYGGEAPFGGPPDGRP